MSNKLIGAMQGYGLIESMATLLILSTVAGIGVHGYQRLSANAYQANARSAMIDTLMKAGTHALVVQQRIVVCPSIDQQRCAPKGSDWSRGWITFIDSNANRVHDGTERITAKRRMPGSVHIISSAGRPVIAFTRRGDAAGSNVSFTFCDARGWKNASAVAMGNSGFWRVAAPTPASAARCARSHVGS